MILKNELKIFLFFLTLTTLLLLSCSTARSGLQLEEGSFEEINGILSVEAEDFHRQNLKSVREWYRIGKKNLMLIKPDIDGNHSENASRGVYLEVLPDTRTNHDEELIVGENFSNEPGKMAVLEYDVYINNPGKYYVWVRAYFTGTEDNGIHVGLNGSWVESGQRMQWCENRDSWTWESKQRTEEVHCGVEKLIYLNIESPGKQVISFSMREDGFEFDKWVMSMDYTKPVGLGPEESKLRAHLE